MLPTLENEIQWNWLSTAPKLDWDWNYIRLNLAKFNPYQLSQNEGIYEQLIKPEIKELGLEAVLG